MSNKTSLNKTSRYYVTELIAILNILKNALNVNNFIMWLNEYHHIKNIDSLLRGYLFFLKATIDALLSELALSDAVALNDDLRFRRFITSQLNVDISELEESCEKATLIKKLWSIAKPVVKSKTWGEAKKQIKNFNKYIDMLHNLFFSRVYLTKEALLADKSHNKKNKINQIINVLTQYYTNSLFLDTKLLLGLPTSFQIPIVEKRHSYELVRYLDLCFPGYTYAVEYVWYMLVGRTVFDNSILKEIHNAEEKFGDKELLMKKIFPIEIIALVRELCNENMLSDQRLKRDRYPKALKDLEDWDKKFYEIFYEKLDKCPNLKNFQKWLSLHIFYENIYSTLLYSVMKAHGINPFNTVKISQTLYINTPIEKEKLLSFLEKENNEIKNQSSNKKERFTLQSTLKKIETLLLSYPIDILHFFIDTNPIFQAPIVYYILQGLREEIINNRGNLEKIYIRVFKHANEQFTTHQDKDKRRYSYSIGILSQLTDFDHVSDYSGWIIFYDCISNLYVDAIIKQEIMTIIEELKKQSLVDFDEIEVSKEWFMNFLLEKALTNANYYVLSKYFSKYIQSFFQGSEIRTESDLREITDTLPEPIANTIHRTHKYVDSMRGKFLELLLYYYLSMQKDKYRNVNWDKKINSEQIDAIAELNNGNFEVYECTIDLYKDNYERKINQAKNKAKIVEKQTKTKAIPVLCTWKAINDKMKRYAETQGVKHICMESIINKRGIFAGKENDKIKKIFEW